MLIMSYGMKVAVKLLLREEAISSHFVEQKKNENIESHNYSHSFLLS